VTLTSSNSALVQVPPSVVVPAGAAAKTVTVTTAATRRYPTVKLTAAYSGVTRTAMVTVTRK